jgi:crossover junction endodeoxyribonuclease RuvC
MELIIGLDLSLTGTGIAVLNCKTGQLYGEPRTLKNDLRGMTRLAYLRTEIISTIYNLKEQHTIAAVFIEGYGFSFRGMDFSLAELGGAVRLALLEYANQPYFDVPPTSLKLFITGKGNSAKNIMLEQVYRKYNIGSEILIDDNQVDAFALAQYGLAYLCWAKTGKAANKKLAESFKKIKGCDSIDCAEAYLK